MHTRSLLRIALSVCLLGPVAAATAQSNPLPQTVVQVELESGQVWSTSDERGTVFSQVLHVPDVPWLRLTFDEALLGATPGGVPTQLRITSLYDGAQQRLNAMHLEQWRNTSAYFNGDTLLIEIVADPDAAVSRVAISSVLAGIFAPTESICGGVDDRELSSDPRVGRSEPIGCTAWIINDANHCFLTAGHCTGGTDVMEFNVPLSDSNGNRQHPGPEDQYVVDQTSMQAQASGIGNDWGYFGVFPNSNTGLTPVEAQGDFFVLDAAPPPVQGQNIRITGYGSTNSPVPPQWNSAQKTHAGPYVSSDNNSVDYQTDTTGGNSGSPIIDDSTGLTIGVHTHGGCSSGANHGTSIHQTQLQAALANPLGVCRPNPDNDDCADMIDVPAGSTLFDTFWATTDGPADNGCLDNGSAQIFNDVWYRYEAECNSTVTIDLCGSSFDTRLAVYTHGCPASANQAVACDDNSGCDGTSSVTFDATGGTGYVIRVGGFLDQRGPGMMSISATPCIQVPANDDCGTAAALAEGSQPYTTINASTDGPDEPGLCDAGGSSSIDNDVWFRYFADCAGIVTVGLCDSDFDTRLAVYGVSCPGTPGTVLACNDDACGDQSEVSFNTVAGEIYRIRVGGTNGATGSGDITLTCAQPAPCPGDSNGDQVVDVTDLVQVILDWGCVGDCLGDVDGNGIVNVTDLVEVVLGWGECL